MKSIVWFRQDLRIEDNPALFHACAEGEVLPIFILDDSLPWKLGGAARWWLHHSLESLKKDLCDRELDLFFFRGPSKEVLENLVSVHGVASIYWNRRYEPAPIALDKKIKQDFVKKEITVKTFNAALLFEPWEIKNKQGKPYEVFTPFWKELLRQSEVDKPLSKPKKTSLVKVNVESLALDELALLPKIPWDEIFYKEWKPGSVAAKKQLKHFLKSKVRSYSSARDIPSVLGTSKLSPHLHFGEISPRQIWHATVGLEFTDLQFTSSKPRSKYLRRTSSLGFSGRTRTSANLSSTVIPAQYENRHETGAEHFMREVGWREFGYHLLYHFPRTTEEPLREKFKHFPWRKSKKDLERWHRGLTGFPIVDAGMRELWHTGWMHNRVRMIVASFLVKDLRIHWLEGAKWFWDTLVDADLASNTLGWQWAGGCGADAAPYFRIFNPMTQGEKFDPEGLYVRKWVPELKHLPNKWIHRPFDASKAQLEEAGIVLGQTYPHLICDHGEARKEALIAFEMVKIGKREG